MITIDTRIDDLADAITVGETNNKTILGGVVFVLVLDYKTKTLIIISLTLTTTTILGLITLEISFILDNLLERHFYITELMDSTEKTKQKKIVRKNGNE